ncbi:anti-sigma factor RsiW [Streptomyces sp. B3I7]|uniref:zf-HC2 domain-containing protein n=1 Tax=Streptomyces sp. B3I7 TaxID=3042269 RepID=UPI00278092FD|nr:zf-HC2 domain-containing protein [Streptomyces sp. B3I7]MDQ0811364.1 anti-sigma factor RsiW [Streptomyces sp. B3I7]
MTGSRRPTPAEQHLGDRLSALVDGELGHESRERVLAHLATCAKCKAEADAQRQLKSVFAKAAPPRPSASFLARLQCLPAGGDSDDDAGPPPSGFGRGGRPGRAAPESGLFGVLADPFRYVPSGAHATALSPSEDHALSGDPGGDRGFRIAHVGRPEERAASRGLRFAFVAAGAVSLAAIALGGVTAGSPADPASQARGAGAGSNVGPAQAAATTAATTENRRRRAAGPLPAQTRRIQEDAAVSVGVGAPLLPGTPESGGAQARDMAQSLTAPVAAGAVVGSPLIRALTAVSPLQLGAWPAPPGLTPPPLPPTLP